MSKRDDAVESMNRLGGKGEPFLFLVDFAMERPEVLTPDEADARGILYDIGGGTDHPGRARAGRLGAAGPAAVDAPAPFAPRPVGFPDYERAFRLVREEIDAGNSYLLNLAFATPVETPMTLRELYHAGKAKYRLLVPDRFACFSPESFVRIAGGTISSRPMKGTIDAALPDAEERILSDPKELAEHTTIVDLIRNDLNTVARDVEVERFRYVERIGTHRGELLQVSSLVTGRLDDGWRGRLGSILFAMLPAGSVTGAPKKKTVEIIRRAEPSPRGWFTGVAGFFDGEALESFVLIRFAEPRAEGGLLFRSGGGITARSDAEAEYREMIAKVYVPAL